MKPHIEIEIDELVLSDVSGGSRASLRAAIEAALVERFASLGLPDAWRASTTAADVTHESLVSKAALPSSRTHPLAEGIADAIRSAAPSEERSVR